MQLKNAKDNWVNIPFDYEYEITRFGHVRNINTGNVIRHFTNRGGYKYCTVSNSGRKRNIMIHRLIASVFIPNPNNKPSINHINCNKTDNRIENLEWCTPKENAIHARQNGLTVNPPSQNGKLGKLNSTSKPVRQIDLSGNIIRDYDCARQAMEYGFTPSHISRCCNGTKEKYKGYKWTFINKNK
jgi:hypothetical protein